MRRIPISILVVENRPMMGEALKATLAEEPDLQVIGEACNGDDAAALVRMHKPDVVLVELQMPEANGVQAITTLLEADPHARVLVISNIEDEDTVLANVHAGALGVFSMTSSRIELMDAIRKVADGVPYLPSDIALKLIQGLRKTRTVLPEKPYQEPLTIRHREILALLGKGCSDQEIAVALHIQEATVRAHVHNLLQRLGVEDRAQAVAYARQRQEDIERDSG
jgi:DNA-binding NarL/FixJ family response regulator